MLLGSFSMVFAYLYHQIFQKYVYLFILLAIRHHAYNDLRYPIFPTNDSDWSVGRTQTFY